ncbi:MULTISPECIES: macro domain-containing protein [unclassified Wenzhouxiangella]|uniref:macro domain-containing protein n=1 Tax=unclassified Wenzhouxiangella TaxID=2613841 RepID=UPI000E32C6BC|nr:MULTISPECIES: macro domain-containing protein [unclassified Wenzhouxiangella]RFF26783.1 macro domain-containing protein [Wenzhouxiangella sp. 15181]RFP67693.1 macro domain-containing protein [Wenzhouxiangella sp. 15190]
MPIEIVEGDIANQPGLDAVVNAANAQLMPGGGVAGALHRAAGPELAEACRPMAPIEPGEAVITEAFELPNRWVIHVLGPRYGLDEPADRLLADGYRNALRLAEENSIKSIGFPALSAGAFGYPLEDAATIASETVQAHAPANLQVRFVLFDKKTLKAFQRLME